jgi:hypothetical protein
MEDAALLLRVPPAEEFDVHADFLERGGGLFDLDLCAAVCQHEGHMAVQKNFHRGLKKG